MKVVVIIPTYQEKENIDRLVSKVKAVVAYTRDEFDILVVDDNSPDGTARLVKKMMKDSNDIHLIVGKKTGLGAAYIRGMKYALKKLKPDVVMEMDADFSHDPTDIPKLINEIRKGADFVIGSRYIKGGKIPDDWSLLRKLNSSWGNRFARYIAGLNNVYDCTAGFRAIKVYLLKQIDLDQLDTHGYGFQMRLLYEASKKGARIKEVPVIFAEREKGRTKIGFWDIMEFMILSFKIRLERLFQKGI